MSSITVVPCNVPEYRRTRVCTSPCMSDLVPGPTERLFAMFLNRRDSHLSSNRLHESFFTIAHEIGTWAYHPLCPMGSVRNQGLDTITVAQWSPQDFAFFPDAKELMRDPYDLLSFFQLFFQLWTNDFLLPRESRPSR